MRGIQGDCFVAGLYNRAGFRGQAGVVADFTGARHCNGVRPDFLTFLALKIKSTSQA